MNHTISTHQGYRVTTSSGAFINAHGMACGPGTTTYEQPSPCTHPEAYRRISEFLTKHPNEAVPAIVEVTSTREATPLESASGELGRLLSSLTARHGLDLGLTQAQIETQIAKELASLGAIPASIVARLR